MGPATRQGPLSASHVREAAAGSHLESPQDAQHVSKVQLARRPATPHWLHAQLADADADGGGLHHGRLARGADLRGGEHGRAGRERQRTTVTAKPPLSELHTAAHARRSCRANPGAVELCPAAELLRHGGQGEAVAVLFLEPHGFLCAVIRRGNGGYLGRGQYARLSNNLRPRHEGAQPHSALRS